MLTAEPEVEREFFMCGFSHFKIAYIVPLAFLQVALISSSSLLAGDDILILKNGDRITGEVKKLERGLVHIDADYGDNIFMIDWEEVERIESQEQFIVETARGDRASGSIRMDPDGAARILVEEKGDQLSLEQDEIVAMKPVDEGFWGRFGASVDFGLSVTKADETRQLNSRASASYLSENWSSEVKVNALRNVRRETDTTRRTEVSGNYRRALTHVSESWFGIGFANFLQSNELQLDLRSTLGGGVGSYLVRNNRWFFSVMGGAAWTNENFEALVEDPTQAKADQNSGEGFGAVEWSLFDVGDFEIQTTLAVFPSFTQAGRVRMNFDTDFKWDLPKDLYFSIGFTDNFDSSPPGDIPKNDYIFNTSVGWSY